MSGKGRSMPEGNGSITAGWLRYRVISRLGRCRSRSVSFWFLHISPLRGLLVDPCRLQMQPQRPGIRRNKDNNSRKLCVSTARINPFRVSILATSWSWLFISHGNLKLISRTRHPANVKTPLEFGCKRDMSGCSYSASRGATVSAIHAEYLPRRNSTASACT
ncbi:hypothetical protein LY76DRAFT_586669 [Colletotrichum caudatum]|nr:hypothetical protein LY76DRAFT_586669 [Colletotrichum caudatum]